MTTEWTDIQYRGFHDVPRIFLFEAGGRVFVADCPFDEELDDYADSYILCELPRGATAFLDGSWECLRAHAVREIGEVDVADVVFDETKRRQVDLASLMQGCKPFHPQVTRGRSMGHRLIPGAAGELAAEELAQRLVVHYPYLLVNRIDGRRQAELHVMKLKELHAPEDVVRAREEKLAQAALITVGNDYDDGSIQFLYFPGEEIIVGYASQKNQDEAAGVAEHVAELLGYDVAEL